MVLNIVSLQLLKKKPLPLQGRVYYSIDVEADLEMETALVNSLNSLFKKLRMSYKDYEKYLTNRHNGPQQKPQYTIESSVNKH